MSKKMKMVTAILVAVLLVGIVGGATAVMAQEEPETSPEAKGLLARVAEILDIPQEDLVNAFQQARQEMKAAVLDQYLDKAVKNGRITPEEAEAIKEWWEQRPEVLKGGLLQRFFGSAISPGKPGKHNGWRAFTFPVSRGNRALRNGNPELAD